MFEGLDGRQFLRAILSPLLLLSPCVAIHSARAQEMEPRPANDDASNGVDAPLSSRNAAPSEPTVPEPPTPPVEKPPPPFLYSVPWQLRPLPAPTVVRLESVISLGRTRTRQRFALRADLR